MDRFNREALYIQILDKVMTKHTIIIGFRPRSFFKSLAKKLHKNLDELIKRSEKYINMEEI